MEEPNEKYIIKIVDDNAVSRNIIISELRSCEDFHLMDYENPQELLDSLKSGVTDMIISDFNMPQMNGLNLCSAVRRLPKFKNIPFILVTGSVTMDVKAEAIQLGVTEMFPKPFKHYELLKYIRQYFDSTRRAFKGSVLIIDNDETTSYNLKFLLKGLELKVYEATHIKEAESILNQNSIDLIFLDRDLPDKSGLEWCQEFKKTSQGSYLPVIGLSTDKESSLDFIKYGANDFVEKELFIAEVILRTKAQLRQVSLFKQLEISIEREKVVSEQKNKLLGMAAHDLRNPLSVIRMYLNLINDAREDDELVDAALKAVYESTEHSLNLINDILDVSSIESGVVTLHKEKLVLNELIRERVQLMNKVVKVKNVLGTFVDPGGEEISVVVDRGKLIQVFDNLMTNAIKYSSKDSTYQVILRQEVEGAVVEVVDQGQGIPEDEVPYVFEAFRIFSVKTTGGEKNTGLGLSIVKKIIESHGGQIWAKSELQKGTTISFVIPNLG